MESVNRDIELVSSTIAVLQNQLIQNELDVVQLKLLKDEALNDPPTFAAKLKAKKLVIPTLQNIVALPSIDMNMYRTKLSNSAVSYNNADNDGDESGKRRKIDLYKSVHYNVFPPISASNGETDTQETSLELPAMKKTFWSDAENVMLKKLMDKYPHDHSVALSQRAVKIAKEMKTRTASQIGKRIHRLIKMGDPLGLTLLQPLFTTLATTSGSTYIGSHVAQMADSESDVSDIEIDPSLKNSDEYMELMKLKVIAKIRLKEQAGRVEQATSVQHHGFSCDSCQTSPIVGIRWKCTDCPYESQVDLCNECIQTDFQTETHKLDHDFKKVETAEEVDEPLI
ncbi:hypothetical protein BDR26DRAFT_952965 [Obelidium mucronatum]|nr:hypothetical protein BDR26DRAFT_952965 [Obelidium mucronatum]